MSLLRNRSFVAAALGHAAVDFLNAIRPMLLAVLSGPLKLTNAMIGLLSMVSSLLGSLTQPLFGWAADHLGARWVGAGGVIWTVGLFALALVAPGNWALVWLTLAALGSGAFHPAGAMEATRTSRLQLPEGENTGASLFFLSGQMGYALAPAVSGLVLDRWGPNGLLLVVLLLVPLGFNATFNLGAPGRPFDRSGLDRTRSDRAPISWPALMLFLGIVATRSWVQFNMLTFLPKFYADLSYRPAFYGAVTAIYSAGGALGLVLGGWLGDRYDKRVVVALGMLLAVPAILAFPVLASTPWALVLALIAGVLCDIPHSILVVLGQHMIPQRVGTASGLVLGFTFASGAMGSAISGYQADVHGFRAMFFTSAVLALVCALQALFLRSRQSKTS